MVFRRLIVLANSYKNSARCVAGREWVQNQRVGGWLRPISDRPEGELLAEHMVTSSGFPVQVLNVVDVPVTDRANDPVHPEDWRVDHCARWVHRGRFRSDGLPSLEETPDDLWLDAANRTDRASPEFLGARKTHQSLYLIRPRDLHVEIRSSTIRSEIRNKLERRAVFVYAGVTLQPLATNNSSEC